MELIESKNLDPTYSTIVFARLDGQEIGDPNWNKLLCVVVEQYYSHLINKDKINQVEAIDAIKRSVGVVAGDNSGNQGWTYSSKAGLSIQGEDAKDTWREIRQLATHLALHRSAPYSIELEFWRDSRANVRIPGGRGKVEWKFDDV